MVRRYPDCASSNAAGAERPNQALRSVGPQMAYAQPVLAPLRIPIQVFGTRRKGIHSRRPLTGIPEEFRRNGLESLEVSPCNCVPIGMQGIGVSVVSGASPRDSTRQPATPNPQPRCK